MSDAGRPNEFVAQRWRTRASAPARATAMTVTFVVITALGTAILVGLWWLLAKAGAPGVTSILVWAVPTAVALVINLGRRSPAHRLPEDDDQSWSEYCIRAVMVGVERPRELPLRIIPTVVFGAPVVLYLVVFGVLELAGGF